MTSGWIYHMDHGWICADPETLDSSIWFWDENWLWTNKSVNPWVWIDFVRKWKWFVSDSGQWVTAD